MYIRRRIRKSIPTWHQARYQGSSSLVPARGFGGRKTSRHLESEWEDAKSTNLWGNMKSKIITSSLGIWSCLSLAECFPEFYCYGNTGEWEQENNWKWNIQRKNVFIWKKKKFKNVHLLPPKWNKTEWSRVGKKNTNIGKATLPQGRILCLLSCLVQSLA